MRKTDAFLAAPILVILKDSAGATPVRRHQTESTVLCSGKLTT